MTQTAPVALVNLLDAFVPFLGHSPMTAYLVMMAIRLVELHRVLKPTGSIYLHCDPTAGHYLKMTMDGVFGAKNFQNEIVWKRTSAHNDPQRYGRILTLFCSTHKDRRGLGTSYTPPMGLHTSTGSGIEIPMGGGGQMTT